MSTRGNAIRLRQKMRRRLDERQPLLERWFGLMGDGEGNLYPDTTDTNYVYVRRTGRARVERVRNTKVMARNNLPVIVGFAADRPDEQQVLDMDDTALTTLGAYGYVKNHHQQHELNNPNGGDDTVWVDTQQFLYMLCQVTDPISEFLEVRSGVFIYQGLYKLFPGATTADLTAYAPGAGLAVMVLISVDAGSSALVYTASADFSSALAEDLRYGQVPQPPNGSIPVAAVYVPNGATTFDWDYVYDWRVFINITSGGDAHNVLSMTHLDSSPATLVRGDILVANNAADPLLDRLAIGNALDVLRVNAGATDPEWGTITSTFGTQAANTVLAGPAAGAPAVPTFRALVAADIQTIAGINWTQPHTFLRTVTIDLDSDLLGLVIQADAGQTANLLTVEDSVGADLLTVDASGDLTVTQHSAFGSTAVIDATSIAELSESFTAAASQRGVRTIIGIDRLVGDANSGVAGVFATQIGTAVVLTGIMYGLNASVTVDTGIAATISEMRANQLRVDAEDATVSTTEALRVIMPYVDTGAITDSYGIRIRSAVIGAGSIDNQYGIHIADITGATTLNYAIYTNAGNVWFNAGGDADTDVIASGDTEPNLFRVDAGEDQVRLGDWDTNYFVTDMNGDSWWVGGGGLPFGSCYGNGIGWTQAAAAQNTWYKISDADMATGQLNLITHDGSGELTVTLEGMYLASWTITAEADAGNVNLEVAFYVDGAATNDGRHLFETAAADLENALAGTAILDLTNTSTVAVAIRTVDAGAPDISVDNLNITLVQIGGT